MFGISTPHGEGVAQLAFFGLFALQHRGQEAAGIAVSDGSRARVHKDAGLVANVFTPETLAPLTGYHAIGHTRYSHHRRRTPSATSSRSWSRRCTARWPSPTTATSSTPPALRDELLQPGLRPHRHQRHRGAHADARRRRRAAPGRSASSARCRRGRAPSRWCMLADDRVIAVRDPWGFRPLSRRPPARTAATPSRRETCALHTLGCVDIDEVQPGEIVTLQRRRDAPPPGARAGRHAGALHVRVRLLQPPRQRVGRPQRAPRAPAPRRASSPASRGVDADVVIPVPDSSIPAAIGYSRAERHPVQRRAHQEPLHRPHVHRAHAGPPRARRGPEVQRARREPRRQAGGDDRRLAGARHHRRAAREAAPRRRRHRGARAHHLPADHPRVPLRRRHGPRRRPDRRPAHASTRSASTSAPTRWRFLSLDGMMRAIGRRPATTTATATPASPATTRCTSSDAQPKLGFEGVLA